MKYIRKRNNRIHLYLSDEEYKNLQKKVSLTDLSREEFIRQIINGAVINRAPPIDYYDLIIEVRNVGRNINQLYKLANAKGILLAAELRKALDENRTLAQKMWDAITVK